MFGWKFWAGLGAVNAFFAGTAWSSGNAVSLWISIAACVLCVICCNNALKREGGNDGDTEEE